MSINEWLVALFVSWGTPFGLGFFLISLGIYFWGKAKYDQSKAEQ